MACACKTNRDLTYLRKNFGRDKDAGGDASTGFSVLDMVNKILIGLASVIAAPFIFIFLIVRSLFGKKTFDIGKMIVR